MKTQRKYSVAFCSPAKSLTFSGFNTEIRIVGKKAKSPNIPRQSILFCLVRGKQTGTPKKRKRKNKQRFWGGLFFLGKKPMGFSGCRTHPHSDCDGGGPVKGCMASAASGHWDLRQAEGEPRRRFDDSAGGGRCFFRVGRKGEDRGPVGSVRQQTKTGESPQKKQTK